MLRATVGLNLHSKGQSVRAPVTKRGDNQVHMILQRYVSADLTHFVGRSIKNQRKRYLLLRRILRNGELKAFPRASGVASDFHVLQKDTDLGLSTNEACAGSIVCFCDIPLGDLPLHMHKYSEFGVAFSKEFLADLGASPVFYVPRYGRPALLPYEGYGPGRVASQAVAFDHFWRLLNRLAKRVPDLEVDSRFRRTAGDLRRMTAFLEVHVISNLKFFDHRLCDTDPQNFYMEREWRIGRDVQFTLNDVQRIIIPPTMLVISVATSQTSSAKSSSLMYRTKGLSVALSIWRSGGFGPATGVITDASSAIWKSAQTAFEDL